MAGHPADHLHRRSGGSNSDAQWRVTLEITFIGDLEGQTQRRNGGSHCWRVKLRGALAVTLGIAIIGDLEGQTQRRNGGSHCGSHS